MLRKLFENWEQDILRPIAISLTTALILFLGSLTFSPVRSFLFPDGLPDYPIYCVAEPFQSATDPKTLNIDFFIINRTPDEYTRESLMAILKTRYADRSADVSPDINLFYDRKAMGENIGEVEAATLDPDFNLGKGNIHPEVIGNDVRIRIDDIESRAVMKVTIVVVGLPDLEGGEPMLRTAKGAVPFDIERYQAACHDR
jgi:hypothetical protein